MFMLYFDWLYKVLGLWGYKGVYFCFDILGGLGSLVLVS